MNDNLILAAVPIVGGCFNISRIAKGILLCNNIHKHDMSVAKQIQLERTPCWKDGDFC